MTTDLALVGGPLPRLITDVGTPAGKRFLDFFTARVRNDNTRVAYFCQSCECRGLALDSAAGDWLEGHTLSRVSMIDLSCPSHAP